MNTIQIMVGKHEITFHTFDQWVGCAKELFEAAKLTGDKGICIDAQGRLCPSGKEFARARDQDAFPVNVYRKLVE
jgi:hypothetical protein